MTALRCTGYGPWIVATILLQNVCLTVSLLNGDNCSLWHYKENGKCKQGKDVDNGVTFLKHDGSGSLRVNNSLCITWNNETQFAEVSYCLFIRCRLRDHTTYIIPLNISGNELNHKTCHRHYNRRGLYCKKCIDGHGPAVLYDGVTCADCSKYKNMWILNMLFQLTCVALSCIATILLSVKGTSSPLNITITYSQLSLNILMISSRLHNKLVCRFGYKFSLFILTIFGVFNLDFFRYLIPPMCLSTTVHPVDVLLLDYIIAISPLVFTLFCYLCIVIHDRNCHNRIVKILSFPMKKCFQHHKNWKPKETILNTFATFLLCGYTKLLFVSVNLLVGIHSYNSRGEKLPNSTVLLYDQSMKFFHSRHIPYVVIALSVISLFVLLPPLLLLLYPTRMFRKCLERCGFQEWAILHMTMDIFQGWYKDGTDGTRDFRPLSAFYMLLRIVVGVTFIFILFTDTDGPGLDYIFGMLHLFFGIFFYTARPYKKKWMNHADGFLLLFTGSILLLIDYHGKVYVIVASISGSVLSLVYLYALYKCFRLFF